MTEAQYIEKLGALQERAPGHPLLDELLAGGHCRLNEIYLESALKTLPVVDQVADRPPVDDVELKRWYVLKSRLFGQRARLSNRMCDLPEDAKYDADRARLSGEIQNVQDEIEDAIQRIECLEAGEPVPPAPTGLPSDRADLLLKRNSLRSSISRARRNGHAATVEKLTQDLIHVEAALQNSNH